jgi:transketolase
MPNDAAVPAPGLDVLEEHCRRVRPEVIRLAAIAKVGHYGPSLSAVELLVSLYYGLLSVRPDDPEWSARDRFVLSKGHACSALYPILVDLGFFDASILDTFTRLGSRLGDHPDRRKVPGVDFSSGSLGHGPSIAAGMAEGLRAQGIDSRVVAIVGDGEQHEGQVWEAAGYAGFRRLSNLLVICDRNGVCVDGRVEDVLSVEPMADRWRAFGWHVEQVDGHDLGTLLRTWSAYDERRRQPDAKPTFVIADTISGRGIDFIEDDANWHLGLLAGQDEEDAVTQVQEATTWARA